MKSFRELKVWDKSHQLTLAIYRETCRFPREELSGLTSQMRRACSSIPANIAEGCGRGSDIDFARYLQIAMGSASELEYHLILAHDLCLMNTTTFESLSANTIEIKRMLVSLIQKLRFDRCTS